MTTKKHTVSKHQTKQVEKKLEHVENEHDLKENVQEIAEKIKDKALDLEEQLEKLGFIKDLL